MPPPPPPQPPPPAPPPPPPAAATAPPRSPPVHAEAADPQHGEDEDEDEDEDEAVRAAAHGPLLAGWTMPASQALDGDDGRGDDDDDGRAAEAGRDADEDDYSQLSQASQGPSAYDESHKCAICIEMLYEPVCGPCQHYFCSGCFYPAIRVAKCCPICRAPITLEQSDPPVDTQLWDRLRRECPEIVERRRKRMAAEAAKQEAGGRQQIADGRPRAPPPQLVRDRVREQMVQHRATLVGSAPDYFLRLEEELMRPPHEIERCSCAAAFVMIRRLVRKEGPNKGREYQSCPLRRANVPRGTGPGCDRFQWVV
jgi:hypothetical protein